MIEGKGFFLWQVKNVLARMGTQSPVEAVRRLKGAGIRHVLVKICDGDEAFPLRSRDANGEQENLTAAFVAALRSAGITVWGWGFVYGSDVAIAAQAEIAAQRVKHFGFEGFVINAEDYGNRRWSFANGADRAEEYVGRLREGLGADSGVILGLSSYRYMNFHPNFPFAAFMAGCEVAMPQVYWVAKGEGDAIGNLRESYRQYKERFPSKLFIPTGAAYGESYGSGADSYFWSASPNQIRRFLDQAQAMALPAATFWSWEHAINDAGNQLYSGSELWDAIGGHRFGTEGAPGGGDEPAIEISVGETGYFDGTYPQFPQAGFTSFDRKGHSMKYAVTVGATPSSVWAQWQPDISESGPYTISVWVPGDKATTRHATYHIHGVVGESQPVLVEVNQNRFYDVWIPLGRFELDANNPISGRVNLTNSTGEDGRQIAFAEVRWEKGGVLPPAGLVADGFDSPVGTVNERERATVWPGQWLDANLFGNHYFANGKWSYHTGADLNMPNDLDRGKPVYAIANGEVTAVGSWAVWDNIIIIRHDPLYVGGPVVYSRSAHLAEMQVEKGQRVNRGDQIGTVGRQGTGPFHLHFDISPTEVLLQHPEDWPGLDLVRLQKDYVDPKAYIKANRPVR
jgi:murein DD-endopeptidase MepM/ murein hydrolase activator NlpD